MLLYIIIYVNIICFTLIIMREKNMELSIKFFEFFLYYIQHQRKCNKIKIYNFRHLRFPLWSSGLLNES